MSSKTTRLYRNTRDQAQSLICTWLSRTKPGARRVLLLFLIAETWIGGRVSDYAIRRPFNFPSPISIHHSGLHFSQRVSLNWDASIGFAQNLSWPGKMYMIACKCLKCRAAQGTFAYLHGARYEPEIVPHYRSHVSRDSSVVSTKPTISSPRWGITIRSKNREAHQDLSES